MTCYWTGFGSITPFTSKQTLFAQRVTPATLLRTSSKTSIAANIATAQGSGCNVPKGRFANVDHDFQDDIGHKVQDHEKESILVNNTEECCFCFFRGYSKPLRFELADTFVKETEHQQKEKYYPKIDDRTPAKKHCESFNRVSHNNSTPVGFLWLQ